MRLANKADWHPNFTIHFMIVDTLTKDGGGAYLIALFDLLVVRLVLDLELLEVDHVQTFGELLLRLHLLLLLLELVLQLDVLQSHFHHLLLLAALVDEVLIDVLAAKYRLMFYSRKTSAQQQAKQVSYDYQL